ncbi:MAG TPA: hypothetical protein PKE63_05910 [Lacibacter sp.]|nr:hypothetical protein [Lacibacter sp.]HMO88540.1 hypothetical protein [Lacibacter sp.]HMP86793.1 hypothetical protein [Lacibacter sp.]
MKQISRWASRNRKTTRALIVFLYLPLNLLAIAFGKELLRLDLQLADAWWYSALMLTAAIAFFYHTRLPYAPRKVLDLALGCCTFLFVSFAANRGSVHVVQMTPGHSAAALSAVYTTENAASVAPVIQADKKSWKKQLRSYIRDTKKKEGNGGKGLLIVLIVLASLGLLILLAALSCNIACNGSEALAYLVFGLGLFGIIFGATRLIRKVRKGKQPADS